MPLEAWKASQLFWITIGCEGGVLLILGDTAIPSPAAVTAVAPNLSVILKGPPPGGDGQQLVVKS